jgi:hypothetical protein
VFSKFTTFVKNIFLVEQFSTLFFCRDHLSQKKWCKKERVKERKIEREKEIDREGEREKEKERVREIEE